MKFAKLVLIATAASTLLAQATAEAPHVAETVTSTITTSPTIDSHHRTDHPEPRKTEVIIPRADKDEKTKKHKDVVTIITDLDEKHEAKQFETLLVDDEAHKPTSSTTTPTVPTTPTKLPDATVGIIFIDATPIPSGEGKKKAGAGEDKHHQDPDDDDDDDEEESTSKDSDDDDYPPVTDKTADKTTADGEKAEVPHEEAEKKLVPEPKEPVEAVTPTTTPTDTKAITEPTKAPVDTPNVITEPKKEPVEATTPTDGHHEELQPGKMKVLIQEMMDDLNGQVDLSKPTPHPRTRTKRTWSGRNFERRK